MTVIHDNLGNPIDTTNPLPVKLALVKTQNTAVINAVPLTISGGATPSVTSASIALDGFDELTIFATSSVSHAGSFQVFWSYDNSNFNNVETPAGDKIQNATTTQYRYATIPVRAPYCKILFNNSDATATPTVTVNTYLKE